MTIYLYACETWTLTAELQRRIQSLEFRCFRKILGISYKDRVANEHVRKTIVKHVGPYEGLLATACEAAKTEMIWARDKIGRPNQSVDTTGNSRRQSKKGQAEKELE